MIWGWTPRYIELAARHEIIHVAVTRNEISYISLEPPPRHLTRTGIAYRGVLDLRLSRTSTFFQLSNSGGLCAITHEYMRRDKRRTTAIDRLWRQHGSLIADSACLPVDGVPYEIHAIAHRVTRRAAHASFLANSAT